MANEGWQVNDIFVVFENSFGENLRVKWICKAGLN